MACTLFLFVWDVVYGKNKQQQKRNTGVLTGTGVRSGPLHLAKYGGPSTTAAKCAAFAQDDTLLGCSTVKELN